MTVSAESAMCKIIGECAACKRSPSGHRYRSLASTLLDGEHAAAAQLAASSRNWRTLLSYQEGDARTDDFYWYVMLFCPQREAHVLLRILSVFEPSMDDVVQSAERLPQPEGGELERLTAAGGWTQL
jgi:hypothetical protein